MRLPNHSFNPNDKNILTMQNLTLRYTGPEALEITKIHFPKTWQIEVASSMKLIKSLMNIYKTDSMNAFNRFLNAGARPENLIITMAALQVMKSNSDINKEIEKLKTEQAQCAEQLIALEQMKSIPETEKQVLRGFYVNKKKDHEKRIQELMGEFEVVGAQTVVHQTSMFDR